MIHEMTLHYGPFMSILNGQKTIEMRLYDDKRKQIKVGDCIRFTLRDDNSQSILTEVISLSVFASFEELYASLPLLSLGYSEEELDKASPEDMCLYYTKAQQAECGVVGIGIKRL